MAGEEPDKTPTNEVRLVGEGAEKVIFVFLKVFILYIHFQLNLSGSESCSSGYSSNDIQHAVLQ